MNADVSKPLPTPREAIGALFLWGFVGCLIFLGFLPWLRDNLAFARPQIPTVFAWFFHLLQDHGLTVEGLRPYWWVLLLPIAVIIIDGRKGIMILANVLLLPIGFAAGVWCLFFLIEGLYTGGELLMDLGTDAVKPGSWEASQPLDRFDRYYKPGNGKAISWAVREHLIDPQSEIYKANPLLSTAFCTVDYRPMLCLSPVAVKLPYAGGLAFFLALCFCYLTMLTRVVGNGDMSIALQYVGSWFKNDTVHEWKRELPGTTAAAVPVEDAGLMEAGLLNGEKGIRLGFSPSGAVVSYAGEAHGILVAPTRKGKGRDIIRPITLSWKDSLIVVCPKGEDPAVTKAYRKKLGPCFVLNPYDVLAEELGPSARYNPMQWLDPSRKKDFDRNCKALADAIVKQDGGMDSHWSDRARALIAALIGHVALTYKAGDKNRNLATVREILADKTLLKQEAKDAQEYNDFPSIRQALASFIEERPGNQGELDSIRNNAIKQTDFIATAAMNENLQASDFSFRDLKRRRMTVYIVSSGADKDADKWFRLVVAAAMCELMQPERGVPVLALIDEFPSLGNLEVMQERVMSIAAGYGLQVMLVMQHLGQLRDIYGAGWEVFASTDFQVYFGTPDLFTRNHVSALAGTKPVLKTSVSVSKGTRLIYSPGSESTTTSEQEEPVIRPHEVGQIPDDEFIIFGSTGRLLRGKRADYRDTERYREFKGRHKPNPLYSKRVNLEESALP